MLITRVTVASDAETVLGKTVWTLGHRDLICEDARCRAAEPIRLGVSLVLWGRQALLPFKDEGQAVEDGEHLLAGSQCLRGLLILPGVILQGCQEAACQGPRYLFPAHLI